MTSQTPWAGNRRSRGEASLTAGASGRKLGKRFSNATISNVAAGISVANASRDAVGQSGQYSSGGRNVRPWRAVDTMTCSPSTGFQRSSIWSLPRSCSATPSNEGSGASNAKNST